MAFHSKPSHCQEGSGEQLLTPHPLHSPELQVYIPFASSMCLDGKQLQFDMSQAFFHLFDK